MNLFVKSKKAGFTMIEVIVVVAIFSVLAYLTMAPLAGFRDRQILRIETDKTAAFIAKTRSLTLASYDDKQYGVRFLSDRLVRFSGATFSSTSPDNVTLLINPTVVIAPVNLAGGGIDILFDRLNGKTNHSGQVTLSAQSDPGRTKSITVFVSGLASIDN